MKIAKYRPGQNIHLFDGAFYLCYQRGLLDWLEEWNPDALVVEANPRYLSTSAAVRWMHRRSRPVLGWGLGSPPIRGYLQKRRSAFIGQFDAMIAYSRRGAQEYEQLGFPGEKIYVAYNSVTVPPEGPIPTRPWTAGHRPYILFVGRLQARKRIDLLLHACAQLSSRPRLVIVGDGQERQSLESLAREIYPQAEFAGSRHGAELTPYYTEADLFVLPGTGGLAVQEAMSHGLPVIVAQGDGTQDDLVRKENGWQIPPGDFDALLNTIEDALSDAARLRRMGAESYRIVKEEINIETMAATFVTALNTLTGK